MKRDQLLEAMEDAHRFLTTARLAENRLKVDKYAVCGTKETATCKRASMDLTRSLARLRKP
ncbi:hypothetical protein LCGC14_3160480 [marine sediment metagenome]|uniref:Uncharacterized protein n=1 Tax=marine sediment metagenome TaxID=412755 RepID=A0A0F8WFI9_9ZZZZ